MSPKPKTDHRLQFTKINYILLILAVVLLFIGYAIMTTNDITISPIILVLAYLVVIPLALLYHPKKK